MPVPQEYDGDGIGIGIPEVTEPLADDRSVLSAAENGALTVPGRNESLDLWEELVHNRNRRAF